MLLEGEREEVRRAARELMASYRRQAELPLEGVRLEALPTADEIPSLAAVDGGSCTLLDAVACGCIAVRAAFTVRNGADHSRDGPLVERVQVVTRGNPATWWDGLVREFGWGQHVDLPALGGNDALPLWRDAARSILEYHAARAAVRELSPGDLLLLDGSLESDFDLPGLASSLAARASERGVGILAVSKDSSRSLRGLLPFPIELEELAQRTAAPPRFAADVTGALGLRDRGFRTYGVRWDPRGPVFRVDVPADTQDPLGLMTLAGDACNDPTAVGYPYPLLRAHRRAHYPGSTVTDLSRAMEATVSESAGTRLGWRLFGRGRDLVDLAA